MKHKNGDKIRRQGFPFTKLFFINRNRKIGDFYIYLFFFFFQKVETNLDTKHDEYKMQRITHGIANQTKYLYNVHWIRLMSGRDG